MREREREEILSDQYAILLRENFFKNVWWIHFVLIMFFCFTITNSFKGKFIEHMCGNKLRTAPKKPGKASQMSKGTFS